MNPNVLVKINALDNTKEAFRSLQKNLDTATNQVETVSVGFGGLATRLAGVAAAFVSIERAYAAASLGVRVAADLETAEIGLMTLLGSADEASATVERLKVEAARTPFELLGLTQATQLLASVTKDGNRSIDIILDIGEALAAMGKGQAELDRIIVNLQQIAAVGRAASIDIKQFAFAGIPIYEMLTETTGKAGEELEAFITEGGVTFDLLTQMFDEANNEGGRFFNAFVNQSGSFNQAAANMSDSFSIMMADMAKESGLFDAITSAMMKASEVMGNWREGIEQVKRFIDENQLALSALAGAITAVLIPVVVSATIAFGAMAGAAIAAFASAALAAAPFLIAGAAIGAIAYTIITNWEAIKSFFSGLWDDITLGAEIFWDTLTSLVSSAWEGIKQAFSIAIQFLLGLWATILDTLAPGWDTAFVAMYDTLIRVWGLISEYASSAFEAFKGMFMTYLTFLKDFWSGVWEGAKAAFQAVWDAISGIFSTAAEGITSTMETLMKPIQKVIDLAERALELGGKAVSGIRNRISSSVEAILDRGEDFTGRASGGPVVSRTPYIVGEAGPELFVPGNSGTIIPNGALAGMGGGFSQPIYLTITGNTFMGEQDMVEQIGDRLIRIIKNNGRL